MPSTMTASAEKPLNVNSKNKEISKDFILIIFSTPTATPDSAFYKFTSIILST